MKTPNTKHQTPKKQKLAKLFLVLVFLFVAQYSFAQLYSSGNNTISGSKVGVSDNTPDASLEVSTNTTSGGAPSGIGFSMFNHPFRVLWKNRVLISGESPYYSIQENTAFSIKNSGNVGVQTDNPLEKFHVNGNSLFTGNMTVGNNNWTTLTFDGSSDNNWMFNAHNDGEKFHLRSLVSGNYLYRMTFMRTSGFVGINNTSPSAMLHVNGNTIVEGSFTVKDANGNNQFKIGADGYVRAREIKVDLATIPDYVFKEDYNLMPLDEVKAFIKTYGHLPNVKSEADFQEEGSISLTEMNLKLLEKVEELTLYLLQLEKRISELEK